MRDFEYEIVMKDLSQFSKIYLIPLADLHVGSKDTAIDVIQGYIDWIKNHNNAFTILNGDMMNCAWKDSTPELFEDLCTPDQAYSQLVDLISPIKNRILMITRGGHEGAIFRKVGADYMARLAHDLGDIPYHPDGGMVGLKMDLHGHKSMFWIYCTHGWGGARTIGAKVKKAQDLAQVADVDVYILSHDHTQNINRLNILRPPRGGGNIRPNRPVYMEVERKLFINTGGFVKYDGYIRRKGYTPQDLGTPRILMEIKHKGHRYEKDLHASL